MAPCNHTSWLQVTPRNDGFIETGRFSSILQQLHDAQNQTPSLLFFLGGKAKDLALRRLFPQNHFKRRTQDGLANITIDNASANCNNPIIIADGNPACVSTSNQRRHPCHQSTLYPLQWPCSTDQNLRDIAFARIMLPFCSVITLFAEDYSIEDIKEYLFRWATLGIFSGLPSDLHPHLLISLSASDSRHQRYEIRQLCHNLQAGWKTMFSSITTVYVENKRLSDTASYRPLKEVILRSIKYCMLGIYY